MAENPLKNYFRKTDWILFGLSCFVCIGLIGCGDDMVFEEDFFESKTSDINATPDNIDNDKIQYAIKNSPGREDIYSVVTESNLFNEDRTFVETEASPPSPTPKPQQSNREISDLKLIGTLSYYGSDSYAFITDKKTEDPIQRTAKYTEGDSIGQYIIKEIKSDRVVLQMGEELTLLKLKPSSSRKSSKYNRRNQRSGKRQTAAKGYRDSDRQKRTSSSKSSQKSRYAQKKSQEEKEKVSRPSSRLSSSRSSSSRSSSSRPSTGMSSTGDSDRMSKASIGSGACGSSGSRSSGSRGCGR